MITIYTDGATEGWNGKLGTVTHCGIGFYCEDTQYQHSSRIQAISNNEAEFYALIAAMEWAVSQGYQEVEFKLDSQLVVRRAQNGCRKMKNGNGAKKQRVFARKLVMDGFTNIVLGLKHKFRVCLFTWIPREQNTMADMLSKSSLYKAA